MKNSKFPEQVVVRLTVDDRRRLNDLAHVAGLTPSIVMRSLLRSARVTAPAVIFQNDNGAAVSETPGAAVAA
jgi:hypothetical protein